MYPFSTSSSTSSSSSMSHSTGAAAGGNGGGGLTRYGSAPSAFLTTAVESVIGANDSFAPHGSRQHPHQLGPSRYFPSLNSESKEQQSSNLQRSFGFNDLTIGSSGGSGGGVMPAANSTVAAPLVRHSSSPAKFLNQLASAAGDTGFSVSMGRGNYNSKGVADTSRGITRLNSQLSFTRQEGLSQIAEENEDVEGTSTDNDGHRKSTHSYATASNFAMGSWEDNNSIMFSVTPGKRAKHMNTDIVNGLDDGETQFRFGLSQASLEMATMDGLLHIPEDSVPCKIRAKRGCATHPRSIAERERRTRISGKLKKLQDLVPNMDKQTSYADMLDLAVQHIRTLQDQVQSLNKDLESCKCGCKKSSHQ